MAIVINGSGTVTGVTNVGSAAANTAVVLQDSGSNTNTCRAWVNFNGTGTVAIRASFNVSSITDNGTGDYIINFTTAMPDASYSAVATPQSGSFLVRLAIGVSKTSSAYRVAIGYVTSFTGGFTLVDEPDVSVSIFR